MGHEFIGIVEDAGSDVRAVKKGDFVVAPFAWSDGTCEFCRQGLQTSCLHGGFWGGELDGGQGEAVRVPLADGTLVKLPVGPDHALMPSLEELMVDILDGRIEPGRVFDRTTNLDGVPDGYRAMNDREAIKVMVTN